MAFSFGSLASSPGGGFQASAYSILCGSPTSGHSRNSTPGTWLANSSSSLGESLSVEMANTLISSHRADAAVDDQLRSRGEARFVRRQIEDAVAHFVGLAEPPNRHLLAEFLRHHL